MLRKQEERGRGVARHGVRTRLLAVNAVVIMTSVATTTVVAALVGPPMLQRLMYTARRPDVSGDHPYQRAFEKATAASVGTALAVSTVAALALSWYLSRRMYQSTAELAHAATVITHGHYDFRVSPPRLGKEFDEIAAAFNTMAQRLGQVEGGRRQMLADLAHEIRTPVAVLEAYLEALEDGVKSFDAEAIGVLRDQSRRLTRFSTDVTALSDAEHRAETIEARLIDIRGIVTTTAAALEPRYRAKGVNLETAVPTRSTVVYADSERVGQVLTNLLDNALRHTPTGGSVSITARWGDDDATVVVSDTGDGIPPEHLSRLFDRFYRVDAARDRAHGGAGIGLAIAKALIEAHGGSIQADSRGPGTGSAFSFSLPRDLLRAGGRAGRPAGASAPGG